MHSAIVEKLNYELGFNVEIESEKQIVYILVETRKLLEKQDKLRIYPTLRLCCDWVVHPKLDRGGSQIILKYFADYEIEYKKSQITMNEYSKGKVLLGFMTHNQFRSELMHALQLEGVNVARLKDDLYWRAFIRLWALVIQDCPLEANAENKGLILWVTADARPELQDMHPGRVTFEWLYSLKDGTISQPILALI